MKTCKHCKTEKPITEYHKHTISKDGYRNVCKVCARNYNRQWVKDNPDKKEEYVKTSYTKDRDKYLERSRTRHAEKREEILPKMREYAKNRYQLEKLKKETKKLEKLKTGLENRNR